MRVFEDAIRARALDGEVVEYFVRPFYNREKLPPESVLLTASGSRGKPMARVIRNPAGSAK